MALLMFCKQEVLCLLDHYLCVDLLTHFRQFFFLFFEMLQGIEVPLEAESRLVLALSDEEALEPDLAHV